MKIYDGILCMAGKVEKVSDLTCIITQETTKGIVSVKWGFFILCHGAHMIFYTSVAKKFLLSVALSGHRYEKNRILSKKLIHKFDNNCQISDLRNF